MECGAPDSVLLSEVVYIWFWVMALESGLYAVVGELVKLTAAT